MTAASTMLETFHHILITLPHKRIVIVLRNASIWSFSIVLTCLFTAATAYKVCSPQLLHLCAWSVTTVQRYDFFAWAYVTTRCSSVWIIFSLRVVHQGCWTYLAILRFFPLHSTVLEPNFNMSLSQHQTRCQFNSSRSRNVFVEVKLLFELQQLKPGVGCSCAFVVVQAEYISSWVNWMLLLV